MKSLDFSNAFVQAKLPDDMPVFAHLPRGFRSMIETQTGARAALRMKKSIYGMAVAPRLWHEHLVKGLKKLGFQQSKHDNCLFFKKDHLLVVYVDDCGLSCRIPSDVDKFVSQLRALGFELEIEGDFTAFLGVAIEHRDDGSIHMHQRGLIKKILKAAKMEDCKGNWTPASAAGLGSAPDGETFGNEPWNYQSIVGALLYLCTNTRPDISMAVSQVSRFNKNPKKSHATAVKMILRYLKQTMNMGIIVRMNNELNIKCFADAAFADGGQRR